MAPESLSIQMILPAWTITASRKCFHMVWMYDCICYGSLSFSLQLCTRSRDTVTKSSEFAVTSCIFLRTSLHVSSMRSLIIKVNRSTVCFAEPFSNVTVFSTTVDARVVDTSICNESAAFALDQNVLCIASDSGGACEVWHHCSLYYYKASNSSYPFIDAP